MVLPFANGALFYRLHLSASRLRDKSTGAFTVGVGRAEELLLKCSTPKRNTSADRGCRETVGPHQGTHRASEVVIPWGAEEQ